MSNQERHPLYHTWHCMWQRCYRPEHQSYKYYGARGIRRCVRWRKFKNFLEDMLPTYKEGLSLDRIDNKKGYNKENCRWVTYKQQILGRGNTRWITFKGKTMVFADWAKELGIKRSTLEERFYVLKWSYEKCLSTPVRRGGGYNRNLG